MTDYQTGDTVRIQATFSNFAGAIADLAANPTLKIYDDDETLVTTVTGASLTHPSTGVYYYDYTLPTTKGAYYYEFSGTVDSTTILRRGKLVVGFI